MKTTLEERQAFVAVVHSGSITVAAELLEQTVSGVSRALGRLETKLETTLLRRTTRRIELTDELNIDLLERRTDVAIRIGELRDSTLHARPLGTSRIRVLASPGYLEKHGRPRNAAALAKHTLLGFTQPESLNRWPLRGAHGDEWQIAPAVRASSGETLRQLALEGAGLVCLSDFMTAADREGGALVQVLAHDTADVRQGINAVYHRNTMLTAHIACFLDFLAAQV